MFHKTKIVSISTSYKLKLNKLQIVSLPQNQPFFILTFPPIIRFQQLQSERQQRIQRTNRDSIETNSTRTLTNGSSQSTFQHGTPTNRHSKYNPLFFTKKE